MCVCECVSMYRITQKSEPHITTTNSFIFSQSSENTIF